MKKASPTDLFEISFIEDVVLHKEFAVSAHFRLYLFCHFRNPLKIKSAQPMICTPKVRHFWGAYHYIALGKKISIPIAIGMFCCGFLFLCAYQFIGYEPRYVIHWTGTSFLASMYVVPVVWLLIKKCRLRFAPVEFLGRASYHIFVMQMLYYYAVAPLVYQSVQSRKLQLLVSMGCSLCSGILFYFVETPLSKFLQNKIIKNLK